MSRVHFHLTETGLYAANTGRPFTVGGLEALCSSHISDKLGEPKVFESVEVAQAKVAELRDGRLRAYTNCPGDIRSHAEAEAETCKDYSNRLLLELLQNADDAAADEPIGHKGLGFKAVLDVADRVRIRSEHLQLLFCRDRSADALMSAGFQDARTPVLRLPFWDDEPWNPPEGLDGFDTVVYLEFRETALVRDTFLKEWGGVSQDETILLFLHALTEVTWKKDEQGETTWRCDRKDNGSFIELTKQAVGGEGASSTFRMFRSLGVQGPSAVAVRLDTFGKPSPLDETKLRVFFPTDENCPVPMILHGTFDLEQNRKRIRKTEGYEDTVVALADAVVQALESVDEDGAVVDLLKFREGLEGVANDLWKAIKKRAKKLCLPQSKVPLGLVRLCPSTLKEGQVGYSWRRTVWNSFRELLLGYRPRVLETLNVLLPGTETESREHTICGLNGQVCKYKDGELFQAALVPLMEGGGCGQLEIVRLFLHPKEQMEFQHREGVPVGFLPRTVSEAVTRQTPLKDFLGQLGVREFSPQSAADALAKCDLVTIKPEELWTFCLDTIAPLLTKAEAVVNWRDRSRARLARLVKVPCRNGQWVAAVNVYAGKDWTGTDCSETAFTGRPDRAFFDVPPQEEQMRSQVEFLARWLGVGWAPKILPLVGRVGDEVLEARAAWVHDQFVLKDAPPRWKEHCKCLDFDEQNRRREARLTEDWTIDGGEEVLLRNGVFQAITKEWQCYEKYLRCVVSRKKSRSNPEREDKHLSSFARHLFFNVNWVPVEGLGSPVAAEQVFVKGKEVERGLHGWVYAAPDNLAPEVAEGIGIRAQWSQLRAEDWKRWLESSKARGVTSSPECHRQIQMLYSAALAHFRGQFEQGGWCLVKQPDNTEKWLVTKDFKNVFYVDRSDLSRLRLPTLKLFPLELGQAKNKSEVERIFEVRPLSNCLRGSPEFTNGDFTHEFDHIIVQRIRDRRDCLLAYLRVKGRDCEKVASGWEKLDWKIGAGLRVRFVINGKQLQDARPSTYLHVESHSAGITLWLEAAEYFAEAGVREDLLWDEVGLAFSYVGALPPEEGQTLAELLRCKQENLKQKLRHLHVTDAEIEAVLTTIPHVEPPRSMQVSPEVAPVPDIVPSEPATPERPAAPSQVPFNGGRGGGHWRPGTVNGNGGGHGGGSAGGESVAHRSLKELVFSSPTILGVGMQAVDKEMRLTSRYTPDVVLKDAEGRYVAVEVETEFPNDNDTGVWQAVAYKHLVAAEFKLECREVRGMLVAPRIPDVLKKKCLELGVEPVELGQVVKLPEVPQAPAIDFSIE